MDAAPPKKRWGHYAKWALRHTERLVPLINRPTRATTTIPGPTKAKGAVDARTGPKGRAVAKMAAKAGLRCLVCHAVTHTRDHTRVENHSSGSAKSVEPVQRCNPSLYCVLSLHLRCHCGSATHCPATMQLTPAQVLISLQALHTSRELSGSTCPSLSAALTWPERARPPAEGLSSLIAQDHVGIFAGKQANRCDLKILHVKTLCLQQVSCSEQAHVRRRFHTAKPGMQRMSWTACTMLKYATRWILSAALILGSSPCVMHVAGLCGPWTPAHERGCATSIPLDGSSGQPDMYASGYYVDSWPLQRTQSQRLPYSLSDGSVYPTHGARPQQRKSAGLNSGCKHDLGADAQRILCPDDPAPHTQESFPS